MAASAQAMNFRFLHAADLHPDSPLLDDPRIGEALTDLLEANRLWLTVEKFYR